MSRFLSLAKPSLCAVLTSLLYNSRDPLVSESAPGVYAWGLNSSGQLGLGSEASKGLPTQIRELSGAGIVKVHSSGFCNATAALSSQGRIYTWGSGIDGVLGQSEDDSNVLIPTSLERLKTNKFVKAACGGGHMAALDEDGKVFTWGLDSDGQLGHKAAEQDKNPKFYKPTFFQGGKPPALVSGPLETKKIIDISCGRYFTAAVSVEGEVFTWGMGQDFALGHGTKANQALPRKVEALAQEKIAKISCGKNFCVALTTSGRVFTWGNNDLGQLGISNSERCRALPTLVGTLEGIVDVSAGDLHVLALTRSGEVYSWGNGIDGQLGHNNLATQSTPRLIKPLPQISKIACGGGHSAFIASDFSLFLCGRGRDGQLGRQGKVESVASYKVNPSLVEAFQGQKVLEIACGQDHTIAIAVQK